MRRSDDTSSRSIGAAEEKPIMFVVWTLCLMFAKYRGMFNVLEQSLPCVVLAFFRDFRDVSISTVKNSEFFP